jgi:hypothetical protein
MHPGYRAFSSCAITYDAQYRVSMSASQRYADERRGPRCLRFPSARSAGLAALSDSPMLHEYMVL